MTRSSTVGGVYVTGRRLWKAAPRNYGGLPILNGAFTIFRGAIDSGETGMRGLYLAAAAACALVAGQAGAAVTAVSGYVNAEAYFDPTDQETPNSDSFTGPAFQDLSRSVDLSNSDGTVTANVTGSLTLKSASEGELFGYGYAYNAFLSTVPGMVDSDPDTFGTASYTFSIDRVSYLKLDGDQQVITYHQGYDEDGPGHPLIDYDSSPATLAGGHILSSNGQGLYKIAPGQYYLGIAGSAFDHLTGEFLGPTEYGDPTYIIGDEAGESWNADVKFTISAVPEPASWAMMIGGLGFVGASLRRRALALA